MGAYVLITFDVYSRPSETLWARVDDIIGAVPQVGFSTTAIRLNPKEEGVPSKTGAYGEVLRFTNGKRKAAGEITKRSKNLRKLFKSNGRHNKMNGLWK